MTSSLPTGSLTRAERHRLEHLHRLRRRAVIVGASVGALALVGGIAVAEAAALPPADANGRSTASAAADGADRGADRASRDLSAGRTALAVTKKATATTSTVLPAGAVTVDAASWHVDTSADASQSATVGELLAQQGVTPDADDRIVVAPPTAAQAKFGFTAAVTVQRVETKKVTTKTTAKHKTVVTKDASRYRSAGDVVERQGKDGVKTVVQRVTTVDGKVTARKTLKTTSTAVDTVVVRGTKADPAKATAAQAQAIARSLVAARGWGSGQFQCLVNLWNRESGWNVGATNPSSGAYGIPQSLPASKMASAGADWRTSARTQITWGLNYIAGSYGTPCGAWSHSQATGWY